MQGMRFNFTGNLALNDMSSKNPWFRDGNGKGYKAVSGAIVKDANNRAFVELFGMKPSDGNIKTMYTDPKGMATIKWEDRKNPEIVSKVASFKKNVIDLGEFKEEFIHPYDAVEFLVNNIDSLKNHKITVTGDVAKDFYNGSVKNRYNIRNIYLSKDEAQPKLQITGEIFWTYDAFDTTDWKNSKKIYMNAYTLEYIPDEKKPMYVSQTFVLDGSSVNFEDEKQAKWFGLLIKQVGLKYDNGVIKNTLKKDSVYHIVATFNLINGNEVVPFDESTLTENQKEMLACGFKTLDDFKRDNVQVGNRVTELRIVNYDIANYPDGCEKFDISLSEFEDLMYVSPQEENEESVLVGSEEPDDDENPFD